VSIDFSVVIPTFRRPSELIEAISSVRRQHDATIEVFVIDDSPEGSAEEAVRGIGDSRIIYLKNPNPTGGVPSAVRNIGWPMANGTFVHFLDDDDIVTEGHYAAIKTAFAANPTIGLVFGRIEPFGSGPAAQLDRERQYFADAARKAGLSGRFGSRIAFTGRMLFDKALLVCSASVIRRECVARLGGFDPSIRLKEDVEFHVRAMRECGVHGHGRRACVPSEVSGSAATMERVLTDDVSRRKPRTKWVQRQSIAALESLRLSPGIRNATLREGGNQMMHSPYGPLIPAPSRDRRRGANGVATLRLKVRCSTTALGRATARKVDKAVHDGRRAPAAAISCKIVKWRATVDEDEQYCFAVAL
jgi:hypothetical protein